MPTHSVTTIVFIDPVTMVTEGDGAIEVCTQIMSGFPESGLIFLTLETEDVTAVGKLSTVISKVKRSNDINVYWCRLLVIWHY